MKQTDYPPAGERPAVGAETAEGNEPLEREAPVTLARRFFRPQTIISFLFSFAILIFFLTRINISVEDVLARMASANPLLLTAGLLAYYLTFPVRGLRWRLLLANSGLERQRNGLIPGVAGLSEIVFLSWFANCIVPAKLGDAFRSYLLKQRAQVSFSTTMGTIVTERITDLLVLFGLMWLAGLVAFHGSLPPSLLFLIVFGAILAGIVLIGLLLLRGLRPLVARLVPNRFNSRYLRLEQAILHGFRPRTLPQLVAYTGLVWLLEGLRLYCVTAALGLQLPLSVTLFIALASSLLTTVPFTPAGLGVVESAVVTVLLWFNIDEATAVSVSFLDRLISYWSIIGFGLIVYLISANRARIGRLVRSTGGGGQ